MATTPFTLENLLPLAAGQTASYLSGQRADGALVRADWGLDDPGGTASLASLCVWLTAMRAQFPDLVPESPSDEALHDAGSRALDYLESVQRPSGLTDLRDCNFDSSPDARFILQVVCPALLQSTPPPGGGRGDIFRLAEFARRMTVGARDGGFHTPNHRWVISAGLALGGKLFPETDVGPTIRKYLAEGFDLNADGAWIERSAGVYDAICARALLHLYVTGYAPDALDAVCKNLDLNLALFHADGTIETGLSRRQDYGTRSVPGGLISAYVWAGLLAKDERYLGVARWLYEKQPSDFFTLANVILAHGEPPDVPARAPDERFTRHFPALGAWRVRDGETSATVFSGTTRLLHLVHGQAELASLKISQSYFGVGNFVGDSLAVDGEATTLRSEGLSRPLRPGYEQPLGRPVPPDEYVAMRSEREVRRVPPCTSELTVEKLDGRFRLRYRTLDGLDWVPAQMAFDFPEGGVWETDDTCFSPKAGQVIFLKRGAGTMRFGRDSLTIDGGADAHRMVAMRDAETAPGFVRVLLTFVTPLDHEVFLRFG